MIETLNHGEPSSDMLTAAILLSSYELIAAVRNSYKSHYEGALNLIRTRGISARSVGLDRANFFVYLRHEITIALTEGLPLQFDPLSWNITKPEAGAREDDFANYLMLLIGHIVNVIHSGDDSLSDRICLKSQIDEWYSSVTQEFRGIPYGEVTDNKSRKIFFPVPATGKTFRGNLICCNADWVIAAAMIWFYAARILLLAEDRTSDQSCALLVGDKSLSPITEYY